MVKYFFEYADGVISEVTKDVFDIEKERYPMEALSATGDDHGYEEITLHVDDFYEEGYICEGQEEYC